MAGFVRTLVMLVTLAALTGCGGSGGGSSGAAGGPGSESTPTSDTVPTVDTGAASGDAVLETTEVVTIPATPLVGTMGKPYKVSATASISEAKASELPIPPAGVEAHWYRSGDRYVIVYKGISLDDAPPLCPGNSILIETDFTDVSNAPSEEGGCTGRLADNEPEPPGGVRACGPLLVYVTAVPSDAEGTLYGSVESMKGDDLVGFTSVVPTSVGQAPEIELSSAGYKVPKGTVPGGATDIAC